MAKNIFFVEMAIFILTFFISESRNLKFPELENCELGIPHLKVNTVNNHGVNSITKEVCTRLFLQDGAYEINSQKKSEVETSTAVFTKQVLNWFNQTKHEFSAKPYAQKEFRPNSGLSGQFIDRKLNLLRGGGG